MPRQPRKVHCTKFFHIMAQGINREYIFQKEIYKKRYLSLLKKATENNVKILAYCIMDNHVHILIETENSQNMSKFMGKTNLKFAMYFNYKEDRVGVVFRNRYRSEAIYEEKNLRRCIAYIHNNPVKAKMVNKPEEYKYSSYSQYLNNEIPGNIFSSNGKLDENEFRKEHKIKEYEKFIEYQGSSIDIKCVIDNFLEERCIEFSELEQNRGLLKQLVKEIKECSNASNASIARKLNISSVTISKYIKEDS